MLQAIKTINKLYDIFLTRIGLEHTFDRCGLQTRLNKTTMYVMDYPISHGEFKKMDWSRCSRLMFDYFIRLDSEFKTGKVCIIDSVWKSYKFRYFDRKAGPL